MSIWNDQTTYTAVRKEEERFLYIYTPLNCPESRNRDKFLSIKTHPNDCHIIVYIKLILKFVFVFTFCSERNNKRPLDGHHGKAIEGCSCRQRNLIF